MPSEQKDILRIDNIKLLKVITDPIRKQIIDVLYDEPLTASEISDEINFPKDKIYYHIKKLKSSGILIIAESEKIVNESKSYNVNNIKKSLINLVPEYSPDSQELENLNFFKTKQKNL